MEEDKRVCGRARKAGDRDEARVGSGEVDGRLESKVGGAGRALADATGSSPGDRKAPRGL